MKKFFSLAAITAALCFNQTVFAQSADLISAFLGQAKSASDSQLGSIASALTGKMQALGTALGTNAVVTDGLNSVLQSLTGSADSTALTSAFKLAETAKLTSAQLDVAKQVGNLASAYVVQKNFASLEGSQSDVATIVSSLRNGKITEAITPIKNVAQNAHLTDGQKQLITTVADKYAPGWQKAKGAMDGLKKFGF